MFSRERRSERIGGDRRSGGGDCPGAVDRQCHTPAHARGDELVDRGVDRCVLAADPRAREHAEEPKLQKFQANAVATVKSRYTPSVTMKSFFRAQTPLLVRRSAME
jgi:hypothetical protein